MKEVARYWRLNGLFRKLEATKVNLTNPGEFVFLGGASGRVFKKEPDGKLVIPSSEEAHKARVEILFQAEKA